MYNLPVSNEVAVDRKPDWPALVLMSAVVFGAAVRFAPAASNGFPLNDGGMFHVMIQDLKANRYLLPLYTSFNQAGIPFAYPPLGFYMAAALSDLLHLSELTVLTWLPALVNTISILAFYKFSRSLLPSRSEAALAALIYALSPRAFLWQVMGGGITRALGMFFLLLMLWQVISLFKDDKPRQLVLTMLFGAGAVLKNPQTALHAALGGVLIFIFYGRTRRGVFSAALIGLGVALLTLPWWGLVLSRYGLAPLLSAGQTSQRTLEAYLALLQLDNLGNVLFLPALLLAAVGAWIQIRQREYFLSVWPLLVFLADPRGAGGIALLPLSMLAGIGLNKIGMRLNRSDDPFGHRMTRLLLPGLTTTYLVLAAGISDLQLINTSLKRADLEMIEWVKGNISGEKMFLLATGREYSMSDPLQEWFPALTGQRSLTTMQGLEWTLGERFFPWYDELIAFQGCADVQCVEEWSIRNGVGYDYLVVLIPRENDERDLAKSLRDLGLSVRSSDSLIMVYESPNAMVSKLTR
ncbi:MAG: hypothetical protein FJZ87_00290 [Chloroflexi bacterium]|nr:hypothetical protein [Chloroflexota bacterium]